MDKGLVHLYYGSGKGKTTAAAGLALRAMGHGRKTVVVQFLKNGESGEIQGLRKLGAAVLPGKEPDIRKFPGSLDENERIRIRERSDAALKEALAMDPELLILDELCAAVSYGLIDEEEAKRAVTEKPCYREIVITGRKPAGWMTEAADYITCMNCERHPHEKGTVAREGIEF